jgi:ABC-type spermidine/putrescine transport system permease subunit I
MKNKNIRLFLLLLPLIVLLLAFLIVPLGATVISSFISDDGGFTLSYYKEGLNRIYFNAMKTSLILSICVTLIGTVVGSFIAYCISIANPKFKQFLMNLA